MAFACNQSTGKAKVGGYLEIDGSQPASTTPQDLGPVSFKTRWVAPEEQKKLTSGLYMNVNICAWVPAHTLAPT